MLRILMLLFACSTLAQAQTMQTMKRLPDTGQTSGYTNTFGEDNDYTIHPPAYLDLNNGTVCDTVTTLMWQKTDGGEMTIEKAELYCDTLTLAGFTDWRLPTARESFSILIHQNNNPALNTQYFPATGAEYWWTSERQANDTNKIWVTNAGGGVGNHLRTETLSAGGTKKFHVRAVRDASAPVQIPAHFSDPGDSTIVDNLTHLVWQKFPSQTAQTWEQALSFAEGLSLAGQTDWRLPNIKELQSLNDESVIMPSVTTPYFQALGVKNYWSSTSLPNQTTKAWYWSTQYGITTYDTKTNTQFVLCVRNQTLPPAAVHGPSAVDPRVLVYPNPADRLLFLETAHGGQEEFSVMLSNLQGQTLLRKSLHSSAGFLDLSGVPSGTYVLLLHCRHGVFQRIVQVSHN